MGRDLIMAFLIEEEDLEPVSKGFVLEKEPKSFRKKLKESSRPLEEFAEQFGLGLGSEALASPKTVGELLAYGSKFLAQRGEEQAEAKGTPLSDQEKKITRNVLNVMGFPLKILNKIGYPSKEEFAEGLAGLGQQKVETEPQTGAGRFGKTAGEFTAFALPGKSATLPMRLALGGLSAAGYQGAEELGAGEGGKIASSIALPVAALALKSIATKRFSPSEEELKNLADFFRNQGLNETEITTLLQPKQKVEILGKIAKSVETRGPLKTNIPETLKSIENKLGGSFNDLNQVGANLPPVERKALGNILKEFDGVVTGIEKSRMPGPDKLKAKEIINTAINDIGARGLNAEEIMETYRDINRAVNWNSYSGGKKDLAKLKEPLKKILKGIDPEVARNFNTLNEGWSRLKNLEKKISPNSFKKFYDYGKIYALATGVIQGAITGNWKIVTSVVGYELMQRIASKSLTDPRYQNLFLKIGSSLKQGSKVAGRKAMKEFVDQVIEDFPEESRGIDWNDLMED